MNARLSSNLFLIPAAVAVVLYLNALGHGYTLDDNAVISIHKHVQAGINGIPKILTTNFLNGIGVNDGLYRPVPLISFAFEKTLFKNNSFFSHLINVLLYAITGSLIFVFFRGLFFKNAPFIAIIISLLFIAHPVHTEVVAGVKGRDDVFALLFLLLTGIFLFKGLTKNKRTFLILSLPVFLLSLCSKESAVAAVAALPILLWNSNKMEFKKAVFAFLLLLSVAVPWYLWRTHVINSMDMPVDQGIFANLNNSLADATIFSQRLASAGYLQFLYIWKLLFPGQLIHDYSYNSIPVIDLANWKGIAGLLVVAVLLTLAFTQLKKGNLLSSGILWFFICIAPVANLFVLIGATFAERFLYIPSLGFSLLSGILLVKLLKDHKNVFSFKANPLFMGVFVPVMCLYTVQTFSRNKDWKDNETLFGADVVKASNSARANYNYGTSLFERAKRMSDSPAKAILLNRALPYLLKAEKIYPNYIEALNNIGSTYFELKEYSKAADAFNKIILSMPDNKKACYNLAVSYEKMNMFYESAVRYLEYGNRYQDIDILFHAAIMFGNSSRIDEAISTLNAVIQMDPGYSSAYLNLGQAYGMKEDFINSEKAFTKYLELNPNDVEGMKGLATTKIKLGNKQGAKHLLEKVLERDPTNTRVRQLLADITI